jgi:hypothetical protein
VNPAASVVAVIRRAWIGAALLHGRPGCVFWRVVAPVCCLGRPSQAAARLRVAISQAGRADNRDGSAIALASPSGQPVWTWFSAQHEKAMESASCQVGRAHGNSYNTVSDMVTAG